ncbi:MAG: hypothetical protein E7592_02410 [Ruminococcaceae bacterium]|nr:hypothetical protein [Oscillospiraceae bacterium]
MDNNENKFQYTYSVNEQEELRRIREKYTAKEETKLDRLRRLDKSASNKAQSVAITVGIIGALILGMGMSLAMTDIGAVIGLAESLAMIVGIAVGFVGGALVALAHPIYRGVLKSERQKIAPEILRLTDELMK